MNSLSLGIWAGKKLYKAYRRDRKNRYRVKSDWVLAVLDKPVPDFESEFLVIKDSIPTIKEGFIWDGASLAPDKLGNWSAIQASCFHDAIYEYLEAIAEAWGWEADEVRFWADDTFSSLMARDAPELVARVYYTAVRKVGGFFHNVMRLFLLCLLFGLLLASGCMTLPPDAFGGAEIPPLEWEKIQ